MATTPQFSGSGFATGVVALSAISTLRNGSGSYTTLVTGAPSIIDGIKFQAQGQTIETMLLIFLNDGSSTELIDEVKIQAQTPTSISPGWSHLWIPPHRRITGNPFILPSGDIISAAMYHGSAVLTAMPLGGPT